MKTSVALVALSLSLVHRAGALEVPIGRERRARVSGHLG